MMADYNVAYSLFRALHRHGIVLIQVEPKRRALIDDSIREKPYGIAHELIVSNKL